MPNKLKRPLRWLRLDNAAKIYPAARRKNWSNVFRQSVTLFDDIDTDVLQSALDITVRRFPSIAARLRKGVFWYYLQQVEAAPQIREEYSYPLVVMMLFGGLLIYLAINDSAREILKRKLW